MDSSRRIVALIPAAGGSRRFNEAGHAGSKALLQVEYRSAQCTMIEHVIRTIPYLVDRVVVGHREEDAERYRRFYDICAVAPVGDTIGQADTLLQMIDYLMVNEEDCAALVLNCDALLPGHKLGAMMKVVQNNGYAQAALVCESRDPNWSFVDRVPDPTRYVEKPRPLGDHRWGMCGAWAFESWMELRSALQTTMSMAREDPVSSIGEVYLSTALNHVPGPRAALVIRPSDVVEWGTPEALERSGARIVKEERTT